MARRRRTTRRRTRPRKSKRGGASAPQRCKTKLKSCLKGYPPLSPTGSRKCFKEFNRCRS